MSVLIYIETREGKIKKSSLEVASYGRAIADAKKSPLIAVSFGLEDTSLLSERGVNKVYQQIYIISLYKFDWPLSWRFLECTNRTGWI